MAIYTRWGTKVRIIGAADFETKGLLKIQDIERPEWIRERHVSELKADGAIQEIDEAAKAAMATGGGTMPLPS